LSSLSIGKKLYIGVGVLVVFTFALGITALLSLVSIGERVHRMVTVTSVRQDLAGQISAEVAELQAIDRGILLRTFMKDTPAVQQFVQRRDVVAEALQKDLSTAEPLTVLAEGKQAVQEMEAMHQSVSDATRAMVQAVNAGDLNKAFAVYQNDIVEQQNRQMKAAAVFERLQHRTFVMIGQEAEDTIVSNRWATTLLLLLTCGVALALLFVVRQINTMLRGSVAELALSSEQIVSAADQISASSQSLAQGASQQAATIEETSSAATEINSMAQRAMEGSRTTAGIVNRSQAAFQTTNASLQQLIGAMDGIGESSQKISKIIKVIDEIAFQTNILALNAAVEAARAGEAGMGFAVVAEEVRNLAQRSAQAAQDTAQLIEDSMLKSESGKVKVDQVAVAIGTITTESAQIKDLVDGIHQGSVEQSRGIEQISHAVTQMEQVTQRTAANAEEGAAAAEELNAQAESMLQVVDRLRSMVDGATGAGLVGPRHRRCEGGVRVSNTVYAREGIKGPLEQSSRG
jgi:methyl-accepting chemotaxis protein